MPNHLTVTMENRMFRFRLLLREPSGAAADISRIHRHMDEYAGRMSLTPDENHALCIAVEELVTNIGKFGLRGERINSALTATGEVETEDAEVRLTIADNGARFDPGTVESPDVEADISERTVGGLGLFMVRELFSEHRYARRDGWNVNVWILRRDRSAGL